MSRRTMIAVLVGFVMGLALGCWALRAPHVSAGGADQAPGATENQDAAPDLKKGVKFKGNYPTSSGNSYVVEEVRGHWIRVSGADVKETRWVNTNSFSSYQIQD